MFQLSKLLFRFSDQNLSLTAGRQTGNGVNLCQARSGRVCVAGAEHGISYRFRRPFFVSFFGRTKKEREEKEILNELNK